jgi:hypothetical protein
VEPEETSIARQRLGKQISATTDTEVAIEGFFWNDVFYLICAKSLKKKSSVVQSVEFRSFR